LEREEQERLERERKEKERLERKERKERERIEKEEIDKKSDITEESTMGKFGYKKNRFNEINQNLGGSVDNKDALKRWEEEVKSNAKKNKRVHHQSLEFHVEEDENMKEIEDHLRNSLMPLGEGKRNKGKSTKIKIYKCVLWKNIYPYVTEDTIKGFIRRSGSQLFEKGGFVIKLPSRHNSVINNISVNNFENIDEKEK
jgi:hypothetical protein